MLSALAWLAFRRDADREGFEFSKRVVALSSAGPDEWLDHARYAWTADEGAEAARALETYVRRWPARVAALEHHLVSGVVDAAPARSAPRLALLEALAAAEYEAPHTGESGFYWYALAEERLERGDVDGARAAAERVRSPAELVSLRADRRFDAIVDRGARAFDVERAANRRVDDLRARALLDQDVLETQSAFAAAMLVVGDAESVLALADEVESMYAASPRPGYRDDDQRVWMLNHRANALRRLGRADEALDVLRKAAGLDEEGAANVSQVLNLGELYCALGCPDDSLATIARAGRMSGFGRMVQTYVQLCAAVQKNDAAGVDAALAYLREHRATSETIYTGSLLYAGRDDEAAATMIERLGDPARRGEALRELQVFRKGPALPGEAATETAAEARLAAMRERADIRAALADVGRIESYPIHAP